MLIFSENGEVIFFGRDSIHAFISFRMPAVTRTEGILASRKKLSKIMSRFQLLNNSIVTDWPVLMHALEYSTQRYDEYLNNHQYFFVFHFQFRKCRYNSAKWPKRFSFKIMFKT